MPAESPSVTPKVPPTLYEWIGGMHVLRRMFLLFYDRVPDDELLAPVFAQMSPAHVEHVAHFVAEVFGGPKMYSTELGGHAAMVRKHANRSLTEAQRQRWMQLLLRAADDTGVPDDPEFRQALVAYLEWGTRLAVINSRSGADIAMDAPMPAWNWGAVGGPYLG